MAASRGYPPGLTASVRESVNGEQAETEGRGLPSIRKRDSLFESGKGSLPQPGDPQCALRADLVHAITSKVKVKDKHGRDYLRSPTVSEAVCMAIEGYSWPRLPPTRRAGPGRPAAE